MLDTVGVTLAGAAEPASRIVQQVIAPQPIEACVVLGHRPRARPRRDAALANGTAAHALDYDDMCFVSLAHPSAPLVPAVLAAAEVGGRIRPRGARRLRRRLRDRGAARPPDEPAPLSARMALHVDARHDWRRGGREPAARLDAAPPAHALAIAASAASGLKENFGTMVKPLHAGLAARNGVLAALLAQAGMTASAQALDGPQGFLHAMDSERAELARESRTSARAGRFSTRASP